LRKSRARTRAEFDRNQLIDCESSYNLNVKSSFDMIFAARSSWPQCMAVVLAVAFGMGAEPLRAQTSRPPAIVSVCAPCHGADGTSGTVEQPNLAGQKSIYLRQQLLAFRTGKRRHPEMREIGRHLTDREIDQIVVYYSTLPGR
jgi:cytochrome c553